MKSKPEAQVGSLDLQRDKAVDNGGLRYGAIETDVPPPGGRLSRFWICKSIG